MARWAIPTYENDQAGRNYHTGSRQGWIGVPERLRLWRAAGWGSIETLNEAQARSRLQLHRRYRLRRRESSCTPGKGPDEAHQLRHGTSHSLIADTHRRPLRLAFSGRWVCAHPICKQESPERNRHDRAFIPSVRGTCQTITELVKGLLTGSSENGLLNTPTRVNST